LVVAGVLEEDCDFIPEVADPWEESILWIPRILVMETLLVLVFSIEHCLLHDLLWWLLGILTNLLLLLLLLKLSIYASSVWIVGYAIGDGTVSHSSLAASHKHQLWISCLGELRLTVDEIGHAAKSSSRFCAIGRVVCSILLNLLILHLLQLTESILSMGRWGFIDYYFCRLEILSDIRWTVLILLLLNDCCVKFRVTIWRIRNEFVQYLFW
jgi:hypothetical protein